VLEPLGIGRQAEALYVALAPLNAATVADLAEITQMTLDDVAEQIQQLRALGLAAETANGLWRALPLSDVVKALRAQRQTELEMATIAAESLQNHLMAATNTQEGDVRIVVGREAIVAVYREVCDQAKDEICVFDKPPYVHVRDIAEESLRESIPARRNGRP
jgi:sugar-specific transcriptional regulator TrmB